MIIDLMLEVFTNKDRPHVRSPPFFLFFFIIDLVLEVFTSDDRPHVRCLHQ